MKPASSSRGHVRLLFDVATITRNQTDMPYKMSREIGINTTDVESANSRRLLVKTLGWHELAPFGAATLG